MNAHNGKIGRLPGAIREQLNQRLADGEPARTVLVWLNALPEVQSVLAAQFAGQPVSEPNLSRWRTGGYQLWLKERERRAVVRELSENVQPDKIKAEAEQLDAIINRNFSTVFVAEYAVTCRKLLSQPEDPAERLERIRKMLRTLNQQRRSEYLDERLKFLHDRLDFHQMRERDLRSLAALESTISSSSELR
jgi:hypothetical protein